MQKKGERKLNDAHIKIHKRHGFVLKSVCLEATIIHNSHMIKHNTHLSKMTQLMLFVCGKHPKMRRLNLKSQIVSPKIGSY